ncbi:hypothetical protein Tcan_06522 [Toxocara canis]|uniref:Uncharacterized protein n=1 Tax=Toxocara canis TaxID=6265 RepID=A0A0B2VA39_TOXCA|nr:hypothetical protein Tcan_06522 [Toxocara canis]
MPSRGTVILIGLISVQISLAAQLDKTEWETLDIVIFVPQNFINIPHNMMGFGLIIPKDDRDVGHNRTFIWRYETTGEMITTYFMDFQRIALRYAREHFGCAQLQGIESEDQKKIHLSEYLYGNELMTPVLANGRNYFTRISASILESTTTGNV